MSAKILKSEGFFIYSNTSEKIAFILASIDPSLTIESIPSELISKKHNVNLLGLDVLPIKGGRTVELGRKIGAFAEKLISEDKLVLYPDSVNKDNIYQTIQIPVVYKYGNRNNIDYVNEVRRVFYGKEDNSQSQLSDKETKPMVKSFASRLSAMKFPRITIKNLIVFPFIIIGIIASIGMVENLISPIPNKSNIDYSAVSNQPTIDPEHRNNGTSAEPSSQSSMLHPVSRIEVIMGNPSKLKLYVFADPLCPSCKRLEPMLESASKRGVEVHVFPTSIFEQSHPFILGIACASDKTAAWLEAINNEKIMPSTCKDAEGVNEESLAFFRQFGFNSTPTVINMAGETHVGTFGSDVELDQFILKGSN